MDADFLTVKEIMVLSLANTVLFSYGRNMALKFLNDKKTEYL